MPPALKDNSRRNRRKKVKRTAMTKRQKTAWKIAQRAEEDRLGLDQEHRNARGALGTKEKELRAGLAVYMKYHDPICHFLWRINDVGSSLIFQEASLENTPPMEQEAMVLFIRYKCGKPGEHLTDSNKKNVVDRNEVPIMCTGEWQSK
jgi:hypothetical protein